MTPWRSLFAREGKRVAAEKKFWLLVLHPRGGEEFVLSLFNIGDTKSKTVFTFPLKLLFSIELCVERGGDLVVGLRVRLVLSGAESKGDRTI